MTKEEQSVICGELVDSAVKAKQRNALLSYERWRVGQILVKIGDSLQQDDPEQVADFSSKDLAVLNAEKIVNLLNDSKTVKKDFERYSESVRIGLGIALV